MSMKEGNNMNICILVDSLYTLGGVQKTVTEICNRLVKQSDINITIIMGMAGEDKPCFEIDEAIDVIDINDVFNFGFSNAYRLLNAVNKRIRILDNDFGTVISEREYLPKIERKKLIDWINARNFDVVIGVAAIYSLVVALIADEIKSKTVGWMHSTYNGYYQTRGMNLFGLEKLNKKKLCKLDKIFVLTSKDKETFKRCMDVKCEVLYNPIMPIKDDKQIEKKYDAIFVGRMNRYVKGLDYLEEIILNVKKNVREFSMVIVGDGKDIKFVDAFIRKNNWEDSVICVGFKKNVDTYYRQAKLLVSTSRWEGFGLSITEAMALGIPAVSFENDGPTEIINNGINGLIIPKYDVELFSKKIVECLHKEKLRNSLSINAIERSKAFELETICKQFYNAMWELNNE